MIKGNTIFYVLLFYFLALFVRSQDVDAVRNMDISSKRCMCRKGFRVPEDDTNKEQFRCVRNKDIHSHPISGSNSVMANTPYSKQAFKVQALQGNCELCLNRIKSRSKYGLEIY